MPTAHAPVKELAEILLQFEGESLTPYRDLTGRPTIGVGATTYPDGREVTMKDSAITQEQSRQMLEEECLRYLRDVENACTREVTNNQWVAMASLAYNVGAGAFKKSTVLRAHNEGDYDSAARAFTLFNKARINGTLAPVPGLTARRAVEAALYTQGAPGMALNGAVQGVAPESTLAKSPINLAGIGSFITGAVTLLTAMLGDAMPLLKQAKEIAGDFSLNPNIVIGVVALVVGATAMWNRYQQRSKGWA